MRRSGGVCTNLFNTKSKQAEKKNLPRSPERRWAELRVFIKELPQTAQLQKNGLQFKQTNAALQLWRQKRTALDDYSHHATPIIVKLKHNALCASDTHNTDCLVSFAYGFFNSEAAVPNVSVRQDNREHRLHTSASAPLIKETCLGSHPENRVRRRQRDELSTYPRMRAK